MKAPTTSTFIMRYNYLSSQRAMEQENLPILIYNWYRESGNLIVICNALVSKISISEAPDTTYHKKIFISQMLSRREIFFSALFILSKINPIILSDSSSWNLAGFNALLKSSIKHFSNECVQKCSKWLNENFAVVIFEKIFVWNWNFEFGVKFFMKRVFFSVLLGSNIDFCPSIWWNISFLVELIDKFKRG